MTSPSQRPASVAIMCDSKTLDGHPFQAVYEKYVVAIAEASGVLPLLLPALPRPLDVGDILATVDGVLMTGSKSNVHPDHYQGPPSRDGTLHDHNRDSLSLDLIRGAVDGGIPLFCICRGFQELNVALGGTLHQHIHELDGRMRHHEDDDDPIEVQYAPVHPVRFKSGGVLEQLLGVSAAEVNSLHQQGIDRLSPRLEAEAWAEDGTIEAVRVRDAEDFALGVQWHPEWQVMQTPLSLRLFQAFGDAVRGKAAARARGARPDHLSEVS